MAEMNLTLVADLKLLIDDLSPALLAAGSGDVDTYVSVATEADREGNCFTIRIEIYFDPSYKQPPPQS